MAENSKDIGPFLQNWKYRPDRLNVRKIRGVDGKIKVQLRLDMGIIQMEIDGRPDGARPFGKSSLLEHYQAKLRSYVKKYKTDEGFFLDTSDCLELRAESIQYYHRYLSLMHLKDYERVIRDTTHNLRVFDFVDKYAESDEDAWLFQQFRPYVLGIYTQARARKALKDMDISQALTIIDEGIQEIRKFYEEYKMEEVLEESSDLMALETLKKEFLQGTQTDDGRSLEDLKAALDEAVRIEDYERAARLRDEIKQLFKKT